VVVHSLLGYKLEAFCQVGRTSGDDVEFPQGRKVAAYKELSEGMGANSSLNTRRLDIPPSRRVRPTLSPTTLTRSPQSNQHVCEANIRGYTPTCLLNGL